MGANRDAAEPDKDALGDVDPRGLDTNALGNAHPRRIDTHALGNADALGDAHSWGTNAYTLGDPDSLDDVYSLVANAYTLGDPDFLDDAHSRGTNPDTMGDAQYLRTDTNATLAGTRANCRASPEGSVTAPGFPATRAKSAVVVSTITYLVRTLILLALVFVVANCSRGTEDTAIAVPTIQATPATDAATPSPASPDEPVAATTPTARVQGIELVGYLGSDHAQAVSVQGVYAYVGIGIQLAILDISEVERPTRLGYAVLPSSVLDIAIAGDYAYVATNSAGLQIVDVSDPTKPAVLSTYHVSSQVNGIAAAGDYVYVTSDALHILDISDPTTPVEVGVYRPTSPLGPLVSPVGKIEAVVGNYAYTTYYTNYTKAGGFRILDVSDPTTPTEVGTFVTAVPVRDIAVADGYAYLLVGQGVPHLAVADISDPGRPTHVNLDPTIPWMGRSVAIVDHYLYLTDPGDADHAAGLQVLDVVDPVSPVPVARYDDLTPPITAIVISGEHAYITTGDGLAIVTVSETTAPTGIGSYRFDTLPTPGRAVAVAGPYTYVAAGDNGLQVVDTSDPANPVVVSSLDTAGHAWDIALADGYAYIADEYNGLRVIHIADPLNPVEAGFCEVAGPAEFFHAVALAGDYAYIADGRPDNTGLRIVDISDPTRPAEVSFLPLSAPAEALPPRAEHLAVAGGYVYLAAGTAGIRIIDVSDPTAPVEIGSYDTPGRTDSLAVVDDYAYVVDGDLRIVDVSDPAAPVEVGFYDIPGFAGSTLDVAVQHGFVYLTSEGVWVVDVSDPAAPAAVDMHPIPRGNLDVAGDTIYVMGGGLFILRTTTSSDLVPRPPVQLVLQAVKSGRATLSAAASFEVHLGYPGPAYWSSSSTGPMVITVMPPATVSPSPMPAATPTTSAATLLVHKMAQPETVSSGDVITYTVVLMNDMLDGMDPGATVELADDIPAYTTYVAGTATSGAQYDSAADTITWAGAVPRGLSVSVSFQVEVEGDAPVGGEIENVAVITDAFGRAYETRATVLLSESGD